MEILGALIAGSLIGAVLGFVGAGGAMLSVPLLIYIFDFSPHHATTAALAIVMLAALSGAIPKIRTLEVLYRDALVISGIGSITNIAFSSISDRLSETFITTGFAAVLLVAAYSMLRNPLQDIHTRIPVALLILISLVIGAMTGLFGIGGGFLTIPLLVLFFGTPQNIAAGTSLLIISMNSAIALLAHHRLWSEISWNVPIAMACSAVLVALLASHKGSSIDPTKLRRLFAVLLIAIAISTVVEALLHS